MQRQPIQRVEEQQTIVGQTHLVKMEDGSIMDGVKGALLRRGTTITILPETKIRSRRGPNQEEFETLDRDRKKAIYHWYEIKDRPGFYVRADTLSEFAEGLEEEAAQDPEQIAELDQIIAENKSTPIPTFLKGEAILQIGSGILKFISAIGLGAVHAYHAMIGMIVGGISSASIGVLKWFRANATKAVGVIVDNIVDHATNLKDYVIGGKRGGSIRSFHSGKQRLDELTKEKTAAEKKVNRYRVVESALGVISSVGNCIAGAFIACLGIVPNVMKAMRSIAQLRGSLTNKKWISMLIKLEAVLSGLLAIFSIEESIRQMKGGDAVGGTFGVKYHKDEPSESAKGFKRVVSGIGSGIVNGAVGVTKFFRGRNTEAAMTKKAAKLEKAAKRKEEVETGKRLRQEVTSIRSEMND